MKRFFNHKSLAINGGCPVRADKWSDNFTTSEEEKEAVIRVMDSGYLSLFEGSATPDHPFSFSGGPEVQALEKAWCDYYDVKHSISVNSATSGLYMGVGALGIGYGDEVIVSPYTMSACAIAPLIYGAIPVFADVDIETGSLCPVSIEKNITPRTKAIILVHQFGLPANMEKIMRLAKLHNIKVIEDCAQAHGAKIGNQYVGTFGDIGVFSLNVNKSIQAGEGGVCITNDEDLAFRLALIRNHAEAVVDGAGYQNILNMAGYNYRLTELQAAIARVQLEKLDDLNTHRLKLVTSLQNGLEQYDFLQPIRNKKGCSSTYYVFPIRFMADSVDFTREQFIEAVNAEGICFYQGYVKPLYFQSMYQKKTLFKGGYPFSAPLNKGCRMDYSPGLCPNAERLHFKEMIINEHIRHPHTENDIEQVLESIRKVAGTVSNL